MSRPNYSNITDHALVRYMERVMGLDLDNIRAEMLPPERAKFIAQNPNCRIPAGGGMHLMVRDGNVVTVAPLDPRRRVL